MKLPASITVTAYLLAALVLVSAWGAFATYRWATASVRCDTRIAEAQAKGEADAAEHFRKALGVAAAIARTEAGLTAAALADAAGNTATRATTIERVVVTGGCTMPHGLPSLQPAVEEARNAAHD